MSKTVKCWSCGTLIHPYIQSSIDDVCIFCLPKCCDTVSLSNDDNTRINHNTRLKRQATKRKLGGKK